MSEQPEMIEVPPIWGGTVDGEKFTVKVCPDPSGNPNKGILQVLHTESGEELLSEDVTVMMGAIFGPDVSDVEAWANRSMEVIDQWYRDHGEEPPAETSATEV